MTTETNLPVTDDPAAAEGACLAPAASETSLAALFGEGPFARLEEFEDSLVREPSPVRELPLF